MRIYECLVIGSGPCGITTAIELKNSNVDVAIIESYTPGGKINIAPRVDNYPGYKPISGPDLAFEFMKKVMDNNIEVIGDEVISLTKDNDLFVIEGRYGSYKAKSVMIASGTKERKLGLDKEEELFGNGISYCAICDGHFFKNKDVVVIGGGNAALKESLYLSSIVNHLYIVHRRDEFRGLKKYVDELKLKENVSILTPFIATKILGENAVEGLVISNTSTNEEIILKVDGIFPLIGQIPNSDFIKFNEVLNPWGNVIVDIKTMETSIPGLFAGGDIIPRDIRQIVLAEMDGKKASKSIINYLNK